MVGSREKFGRESGNEPNSVLLRPSWISRKSPGAEPKAPKSEANVK
jgi:hypothetical protein